MDLNKQDYYNKEFIYFLQHPEKPGYYLIIQTVQSEIEDLHNDFNRTGKYKDKPLNVLMPYNKVKLVEQIAVPDTSLFGLCYFICNEIEEIKHEEDERYAYGEWGWYVINGGLQINKWLKSYTEQVELKKQQAKASQKPQTIQTSLF